MNKKIVWLVVSCLMALSLVLASCAPAVVEEEEEVIPEEEEVIPEEEEVIPEKEMVRDSLGRLVEKPRYGGVLTVRLGAGSPQGFDELQMKMMGDIVTSYLTNEDLYEADWTKGPSGTGEVTWATSWMPPPDTLVPWLAESWERPDPDTAVYHIRKGVHFHDKAPAYGREMDAYDVAFTYNRIFDNRTYISLACPKEANLESITATDKWTVVVKAKPGKLGWSFEYTTDLIKIIPREVGEQNINFNKWENSCGTGPFILIDHVPGSSTTLVRNPNYWRNHPLHPEDTMPYIDGVKMLNIPDVSTQMAALRTGKLDSATGINWEDAATLRKTTPELKERFWYSEVPVSINLRVDKPELPWHDIRVRRALWLAIDHQEIVDEYFQGNAELFGWPLLPIPDFKAMYRPLEEFPESIRELYEYKPEKAKQLLAEAGYPDGFKAEVILQSTNVDLISIAQDYLAKIGVDLELQVVEAGVYWAISARKTHTQGIIGFAHAGHPFKPLSVTLGHMMNWSCVNDPKINELNEGIRGGFDFAERAALVKEMVPLELEGCYLVAFPAPYQYAMWWPWVKGYSGEKSWGHVGGLGRARFIWLDQELKKEMGH